MTSEHAQVVAPRQEGVKGRRLDEGAEAREAGRGPGPGSEHDRAAGGRPDEAEQHAESGRLAGSVRAEESVDLTTRDAHLQLLDGDDALAVAFRQLARLDHQTVAHITHASTVRPGREPAQRPQGGSSASSSGRTRILPAGDSAERFPALPS